MLTLPIAIMTLLEPLSELFDAQPGEKHPDESGLVGAILAPGKRTVTSALRVIGLCHQGNFALYHQVLNRGTDQGEALAMEEQVVERTQHDPQAYLMDGGYVDLEQIQTLERRGIKVYAPPKES